MTTTPQTQLSERQKPWMRFAVASVTGSLDYHARALTDYELARMLTDLPRYIAEIPALLAILELPVPETSYWQSVLDRLRTEQKHRLRKTPHAKPAPEGGLYETTEP